MVTSTTARRRPFPALLIVCILFLACLYIGESPIAHYLPGLFGQARLEPSLIILDIPVHIPVTMDLILVPGLFLVIYTSIVLLCRRRELPDRLGAVFTSVIILACCVAFGGLISWLLEGHLPRQVQNGMESLGINADIHLAAKTIHLHGNAIALICLTIGAMIAISRIGTAPAPIKTSRTRLTREQRMTPYERMVRERRGQASPASSKTGSKKPARPTPTKVTQSAATRSAQPAPKPTPAPPPAKPAPAKPAPTQPKPAPPRVAIRSRAANIPGLCYPEPLPTLQPEAVNYRPLW